MGRIRSGRTSGKLYRELLWRSSWVWIFAFFFLVGGISCGAFTEVLMTSDQKTALTEYLSGYLSVGDLASAHHQEIFISSLKNNLLLLVLMALSCLIGIGFPAAFLLLACKGAIIGFSSALLIENMTYKGTVLTFVSMVPQNLLILPAIYMAAVISANFAFLILANGFLQMKKNLSCYIGSFMLLCGGLALALTAGSFIEAFLCPTLVKLVL